MDEQTGYRISDWDTPLRANPNRSPGRFNRASSPATQYVGLHPLTPWAEYLRYHGLRAEEDIIVRQLSIWAIRVDLSTAVEITFENATDFGIEASDLVSDDHGACQSLADRLREDARSPKAIIVPSAALPGTRNLVVFGERVMIPYLWDPLDEGDIAACIVASKATPPLDLLPLVRQEGDQHAELEAWNAGRLYEFADLHRAPSEP